MMATVSKIKIIIENSDGTKSETQNFTLYFECKYKFGSRKIQAPTFEDAKLKVETLTKGGAWCEGRCDTCKLIITKKP